MAAHGDGLRMHPVFSCCVSGRHNDMKTAGMLHFATRTMPSTGLDGAFRVHVLQQHLEQVGLNIGDLCTITEENGKEVGYGIAWRAADKMGTNPKVRPAKVTEALREAYGIKEGSHINLGKTTATMVHADKVVLTDVTPSEYVEGHENELEDGKWRVRVEGLLCNCEAFASGLTFDVTAKKGIKKRFYIDQVLPSNPQSEPSNLYYLDDKTEVVFQDPASAQDTDCARNAEIEGPLIEKYIGGIAGQVQQLNRRLKRAIREYREPTQSSVFQTNESILIHGFEGTGKSYLLQRLHQVKLCKVVNLQASSITATSPDRRKEAVRIRDKFSEARKSQPSLILMDDINRIAPSDNDLFADVIAEEIDELAGSRVLVIATCRSVSNVNSVLLSATRFSALIELPVPDEKAREQILAVLIGKELDSTGELSKMMSSRTHGFTGRDLALLVRVAGSIALDRSERQHEQWVRKIRPNGSVERFNEDDDNLQGDASDHRRTDSQPAASVIGGHESQSSDYEELPGGHVHAVVEGDNVFPRLTIIDLDAALAKVRPTALREIIFEPPKTTWADIGGSQEIQKRLDEIILWPLENVDQMKKYNKRPKKGVLLYGPPGCSKTLTAQAIATKYGLNFIAIKGGELISMYVGESERSLRDLFRKARAAKPCVIFFDEIDSIASMRDNTASKGLNVLTTLLTEMDGFNSLDGVLILAATNKPEILDPAIMRPGRFDAHFYLGLPDLAARKEILKILSRLVPGEQDLDFDALSAATEGYTGAEIAKIYDLASDRVLKRVIEGGGAVGSDKLSMADFELGIQQTEKGVDFRLLDQYEAFGKKSAGVV